MALKLKKGSNSCNSNPKPAACERNKNEIENDKAKIEIISRWFSFKSNCPIEIRVELEFNNFQHKSRLITLYEELKSS
ncbi:hypothetical protein AAA799E16_01466 [Marine Group I thaumarchaeote SCGC AAA799-E16]|uniref:Uncharacterized protein n=1 Tax=Marine Group I thaumarchaeote SCGC AAA799-E16 TaxID=1502292 RepID=A0A081S4I8_9ARCH|nr:hypothetical protein AAA799E16_01466 [Marine Group I thaumarchaeote SCGC AAA799-E16]